MQKNIYIEGLGHLTYEESLLSGKKKITVDGVEAKKVNKALYTLGEVSIGMKGNFLTGVTLLYDGKEYWLYEKISAYEYMLAFFPLIFTLVWGNIPALISIFPIVSGAVGGAVAGIAGIFEIALLRSVRNPVAKFAVSVAVFIGTALILFALAIIFINFLI